MPMNYLFKFNIIEMKKHCFVLLLTYLFCCSNGIKAQVTKPNMSWGKPTKEEMSMTECSMDKDADAVVLYHSTYVYYAFQGESFKVVYEVKNRLKILKPEGKRMADNQITYIENETTRNTREIVSGLKATAYNMEDGKVVKTKLEKSMINEERLDKNQMVVKFSVPQVKVGTVIEYEYRITSDFFYHIRDWNAQRDIPVLYAYYKLSIPEWFSFNVEETGMNQMEKKEYSEPMTLLFRGGTENILTNVKTFVGRDLPALVDDDFVWHATDYSNKVTAELADIFVPGAVYQSYTSTWDDVDGQLMSDEDFGGSLKRSSPLKEEIAAAGIPAIANKKERVEAVWKLLKSRVKWNGNYALWGQTASKLLKEGTGNNADINFLFINMLHDAGIEASPIVMSTRKHGRMPLTHASMKYLNTFVVGIVTDDDKMMYFDSSAEDGYLNVLPANLLTSRARLVKKGAKGSWINLQESARGHESTSIVATLDANGVIKGRKDHMLLYEDAAVLRRKWREAKDSVELIAAMQDKDGIEIESYKVEGRDDFSPNMKETITFSKHVDTAGEAIYLNLFIMPQMKSSPFTNKERMLPVEFPYKGLEAYNVSLTLPEGYVVEDMPKPVILKLDGAKAIISYSQKEENELELQYQLNITKTFFTAEEYNGLKEFFDKVAECNNTIITIKKAQ